MRTAPALVTACVSSGQLSAIELDMWTMTPGTAQDTGHWDNSGSGKGTEQHSKWTQQTKATVERNGRQYLFSFFFLLLEAIIMS